MKFSFKVLAVTMLVAMSLVLTSCGTSKKKAANQATDQNIVSDASGLVLEVNGDSDSSKAGPLKTVYFDYNSSVLTGEAKATLTANAAFLKTQEKIEIQN